MMIQFIRINLAVCSLLLGTPLVSCGTLCHRFKNGEAPLQVLIQAEYGSDVSTSTTQNR